MEMMSMKEENSLSVGKKSRMSFEETNGKHHTFMQLQTLG